MGIEYNELNIQMSRTTKNRRRFVKTLIALKTITMVIILQFKLFWSTYIEFWNSNCQSLNKLWIKSLLNCNIIYFVIYLSVSFLWYIN